MIKQIRILDKTNESIPSMTCDNSTVAETSYVAPKGSNTYAIGFGERLENKSTSSAQPERAGIGTLYKVL